MLPAAVPLHGPQCAPVDARGHCGYFVALGHLLRVDAPKNPAGALFASTLQALAVAAVIRPFVYRAVARVAVTRPAFSSVTKLAVLL